MTRPNYVLYHASCADGFGAAWAASRALPAGTLFLPVQYGQPLPDIPDGADVCILDFSYDRATLVDLNERAHSLLVLDHHATAAKALDGLLFARFTPESSGAVMAWEYFHESPVPPLLRYVEDRDLWRWQLPGSREISRALRSQPMTFERWSDIAHFWEEHERTELVTTGRILLQDEKQTVDRLVKHAAWLSIAGQRVPGINSSLLQSELGEALLASHPAAPFACVFFANEKGQWVHSLRSRPGGFDVSNVALSYGGGGHRAAAGFISFTPPAFLV